MSSQHRSRARVIVALSALITAVACAVDSTAPPTHLRSPQAVQRGITTSSPDAALLSIEVSDGLSQPLLYQIPLDAGGSDASLTTPAAESRSLVVNAYDGYGNLTHQARARRMSIATGLNKPLSMTLDPVGDGLPLTVSIDVVGERPAAPASLVIQMKATELYEGQTARLSAYATDEAGNRLDVNPLDLNWSVKDPRAGRITKDARGQALYQAGSASFESLVSVVWHQNIGNIPPIHVLLDPYVQVVAGFDFSCGRRTSGRVYCWGDNAYSQLGNSASQICYASSTNDPCSDRPVAVLGGRTYKSIGAGRSFVCGLEPSNAVSCWGNNDKAQLGNGSVSGMSMTPTTLSATANGTQLAFSSISTGGDHSCGILISPVGDAYCWGSNNIGQLGDGFPGYFSGNPMQQPKPVLVADSHKYKSIAAGESHTCGVSTAGIGWCWGSNDYGELGIGPSQSISWLPIQMNFPTMPAITQVSSGPLGEGTCVFTPVAYCDGANIRGQAGIGQSSQVVLQAIHVWTSSVFTTIALGGKHACAVDTANNLSCWGDNTYGQIGIAANLQYFLNHPQQVGTRQYTNVASGGSHSCAVDVDGFIFCWGRNDRGQLGIGSHGNSTSIPTLVKW